MKACRCVNSYKIIISILEIKVCIVFEICNSKLFFQNDLTLVQILSYLFAHLSKMKQKKKKILAKLSSNLNANSLLLEMSIDTSSWEKYLKVYTEAKHMYKREYILNVMTQYFCLGVNAQHK